MKNYFKTMGAGVITMLQGTGATVALLFAIECFTRISYCGGWCAILQFITALACIITFVIIIKVLGNNRIKLKRKDFMK